MPNYRRVRVEGGCYTVSGGRHKCLPFFQNHLEKML